MRETLSLLMAVLLASSPAVSTASQPEAEGTVPIRGVLTDRIGDMQGEAARFLASLPESESDWASGDAGPLQAETSADVVRLRLRIQQLSSGTEMTVKLRDGQRIEGELAQAGTEEFELRVFMEHPRSAKRGLRTTKSFRYEDVESADFPAVKEWTEPSEAIQLVGRNVEILLLNGQRLRGTVGQVTRDELTLELGKGEKRELGLEEVGSLRTRGMKTSTKVVIGVSVAVGLLIALGYAAYYASGA